MSDRMVDASEIPWLSTPSESQPLPDHPVYYNTLDQREILDYVVSLQDDKSILTELLSEALTALAAEKTKTRNQSLRIRDLESR